MSTTRTVSAGEDAGARGRILDAAARLMTTKAPSQITGRELAKEASVNYGLVQYYFNGKNNACAEAFAQLAGRYVAKAQASGRQDWILSMGKLPEYRELWLILAHAAMDGESLEMLGWDYPLLRSHLAERMQKGDGTSPFAKEAIATAFALALGWTVFQPFIREALGLGADEVGQIDDSIVDRIQELW